MGNQIVKEVVVYVVIISFFITGNGFLVNDVTVYWYYPVYLIVLMLGVIIRHKIDLHVAIFVMALWCFALATTCYGVDPVIKQLISISLTTITTTVITFMSMLILGGKL